MKPVYSYGKKKKLTLTSKVKLLKIKPGSCPYCKIYLKTGVNKKKHLNHHKIFKTSKTNVQKIPTIMFAYKKNMKKIEVAFP